MPAQVRTEAQPDGVILGPIAALIELQATSHIQQVTQRNLLVTLICLYQLGQVTRNRIINGFDMPFINCNAHQGCYKGFGYRERRQQ